MSETSLKPEEPSELVSTYRSALGRGELTFQRCAKCENAWLPPRDFCPRCLSGDWRWEEASGRATLVSWVVYHRAFHPAFADRVPYDVILAELDEGPRLISNLRGVEDLEQIVADMPLAFEADIEGDVPVARFRPANVDRTDMARV